MENNEAKLENQIETLRAKFFNSFNLICYILSGRLPLPIISQVSEAPIWDSGQAVEELANAQILIQEMPIPADAKVMLDTVIFTWIAIADLIGILQAPAHRNRHRLAAADQLLRFVFRGIKELQHMNMR